MPKRVAAIPTADTDSFARRSMVGHRVIHAGDLTDEEIALIAKSEVPAEYGYLDEELKDWRP